jgi:hypothetical protein
VQHAIPTNVASDETPERDAARATGLLLTGGLIACPIYLLGLDEGYSGTWTLSAQ